MGNHVMNLIEFIEGLTKKVDGGRFVDVVYVNFSKPFGRLLWMVKLHGSQGELVTRVNNWLHGRK